MKTIWQHFAVLLFIMLFKVVLTFEFGDEILKCDHSNESYGDVLYFYRGERTYLFHCKI